MPLSPPGIVPESDVRTHSPAAAFPPKEHGFVEELGELPWSYGDGRLVVLIRDPQTIYVYWDLSQQQIEQAFGGLGSARASLKLWNVRGNELIREAEVHLDARGWYVRELPSALELRVELWALGERGMRLIRSARPVKLPAAAESDEMYALYARLDLATTDSEDPGEVGQCKGQSLPSITVQVAPFTASVSGAGANGSAACFLAST